MGASGKALISWGKIKKLRNTSVDLDTSVMPCMNVFGNDNIFIIIFGSGYFNWREIRGKL